MSSPSSVSNLDKTPSTAIESQPENSRRSIFYRKDLYNICFLMFLYLLQGVPIGIMHSLPFILSSRGVSYASQGTFSLAGWPFSIKLLWAPIVDSIFSRRLGRRKSWLVPVQYMIGACMLFFSGYVHRVVETSEDSVIHGEIYKLTGIFFLFTFLAATQDIAVDGWGLTIFAKENLEWASICNNAGATAGILIGHSLFLVLQSTSFCNEFIRPFLHLSAQPQPLVNLAQFMNFFGIVYIVSTTLILFFKNEKSKEYAEPLCHKMSTARTYASLWHLLGLKPVQKFLFILLTCQIAFATTNIRSLKMIEAGVPKEQLGIMTAPFQIIQILTPIFFGNLVNVSKPLDLFIRIYPIRMAMTLVLAAWVFMTPWFRNADSEYPWGYFITYALLNGLYSLILSGSMLARTLFFTQISDKKIGGTYMTLMHTISNIGMAWPATLALYLMDVMTIKKCEGSLNSGLRNVSAGSFDQHVEGIMENSCRGESQVEACESAGADCVIWLDAFYTLTVICSVMGVLWLFYYIKRMRKLQSMPKSFWRVSDINDNISNCEELSSSIRL